MFAAPSPRDWAPPLHFIRISTILAGISYVINIYSKQYIIASSTCGLAGPTSLPTKGTDILDFTLLRLQKYGHIDILHAKSSKNGQVVNWMTISYLDFRS